MSTNDAGAMPMLALLQRELLSQMRTRRLFIGMLTIAIAAGWTVLGQWPSGSNIVWNSMARSAENLFIMFSFMSLTFAALIVGAVASNSFVGEREGDSWDLLRLSLITRAGLVFGKLLTPVSILALAIVVCSPVFAALLFLAGVDPLRSAASLTVIGCTAMTCSGLAIACSVRARRVVTGATATFIAIAMFMGLHVSLVFALYHLTFEALDIAQPFGDLEQLFFVSPYWAMAISVDVTQWGDLIPVALHLLFQFGVFAASLLFAGWSLGRDIEPVEPTKPVPVARPARRAKRRADKGATTPIPAGMNPVYRRELKWSSPFSSTWIRVTAVLAGIVGFMIAVGIAGVVIGSGVTGNERILLATIPTLLLFGALGCLYMPVASAGIYTRELRESTYDMLRMTLLTPTDIVLGKFRAMMSFAGIVWLYGAAICLPVSLFFIRDVYDVVFVLLSYVTLYVCLVYAGTTAVLVSFSSRQTGAAIVGSYVLGMFMFFGWFTSGLMVGEVFFGRIDERGALMGMAVMTSPVIAYFWSVIEGIDGSDYDRIYYWFGSIMWTAAYAAASQYWIITRFEKRVQKVAG